MQYVGRFAPSPTGPLHFGSLVAALASYCDARSKQGKWLIRMEDVDQTREMAGAADDILRTLEAFGFEWDESVVYQSQRVAVYQVALNDLQRNGVVYACTCSRKEIADSATHNGIEGVIYPKTCYLNIINRNIRDFNVAAGRMNAASWRINVDGAGKIEFLDAIQGKISQQLNLAVGDFILKRRDGFFAYQLAVVVDDALQNISHVVRGADLLDSTPRQIYLQQLLGYNTPHYAHLPVAVNARHEKLSKQTHASPLNRQNAQALLYKALGFLGQQPPTELEHVSVQMQLAWAVNHWQLNAIQSRATVMV